jgi:hypothetical protein
MRGTGSDHPWWIDVVVMIASVFLAALLVLVVELLA